MTEEKIERLVKAFTVTGTILLTVLFLIVGYQFIVIQGAKKQKAKLEEQLVILQEQVLHAESDLEYYKSDVALEKLAREHGYIYSGDIKG